MYDESKIGLVKGYWHDDSLSDQRFITLPRTGERIYATGDVGRYLPDGNIEILGRNDFQVEIHGHRIELGEIEASLKMLKGVRSAIAVVVKGQTEHKWIVAFVVAMSDAEQELQSDELKTALERKLPNYMNPSHIEIIERLPLSDNGKIDRRRLMEMAKEYTSGDLIVEYVAPRTNLEAIVASLVADVLNLNRVGVLNNFFALGGDSITATLLNNRIEEMLGVNMPLSAIFTNPTVEKICQFMKLQDNVERLDALTEMFSEVGINELNHVVADLRKEV